MEPNRQWCCRTGLRLKGFDSWLPGCVLDRWDKLNGTPGRVVGRIAAGGVGGGGSVVVQDDMLEWIWSDKRSVLLEQVGVNLEHRNLVGWSVAYAELQNSLECHCWDASVRGSAFEFRGEFEWQVWQVSGCSG